MTKLLMFSILLLAPLGVVSEFTWKTVVCVGAGAGAAALAPVALTAAGFTSGGVAAGSVAATIQSTVYGGSVASGSWFAMAQSMGATGVGAYTKAAFGTTVTGAIYDFCF